MAEGCSRNTLHPDDLGHVRASVGESARTLRVWEEEFRLVSPDGTVRWMHGHSTPRREPDGSVIWHGFVSDISQRREAEALLRASEERFRGLFELSPLGIALNDFETPSSIPPATRPRSSWGWVTGT